MPDDETGRSDLAEMEAILAREAVGHLGLCDDGEVYVVPINYAYAAGRLLMHCALRGRKLDMIRSNSSVCFEVSQLKDWPAPHAGELCDTGFDSVICWGEARVVEDAEERRELLNVFQARYNAPSKAWPEVTPERAAKCGAIEITVHRMTGRRYEANGKPRWEWRREDDV